MPSKKYIVNLNENEKSMLTEMITKGKHSARKITRARILLLSDKYPEWNDLRIAEALQISVPTIERTRKKCVMNSLEAVFNESRERDYERKLDGKGEAHLIALACSEAPEGKTRWSLQMLADKLISLGVVESISHECVRQTLKKTKLNHGLKSLG